MGVGAAPAGPGHSRSPAAPVPFQPNPAPRDPQTLRRRPPPPYLRAGRQEPAAPGEVCAWPPRRGGQFPPQPRRVPAASREPTGLARALGAATRTPAGKLRPCAGSGRRAVCGHSLGNESLERPPPTARVPPTPTRAHRSWLPDAARALRRAGAWGRCDLRPGLMGEGTRELGERSPRCSPLPRPKPPPCPHSPRAPGHACSALSSALASPGWNSGR